MMQTDRIDVIDMLVDVRFKDRDKFTSAINALSDLNLIECINVNLLIKSADILAENGYLNRAGTDIPNRNRVIKLSEFIERNPGHDIKLITNKTFTLPKRKKYLDQRVIGVIRRSELIWAVILKGNGK